MKKLSVATWMLALAATAMAQNNNGFTLTGKLKGLKDGVQVSIIPSQSEGEQGELATTTAKNGKFVLKGKVNKPTFCTLITNNLQLLGPDIDKNIDKVKWTYTPIFVDNVNMKMEAKNYEDVPNAAYTPKFEITGGNVQTDYTNYAKMLFKEGKSAMNSDIDVVKECAWNFIKTNPTSAVSVALANKMLNQGFSMNEDSISLLESLITACPDDTARFNNFKNTCRYAKMASLNHPFIDLPIINKDKKEMMLSDVLPKDKLVLLDFWSSTCGICIMGFPDLQKALENNATDFAIVGISSDISYDAWMRSVEKHNPSWPQYMLTRQGVKDFMQKYLSNGVPFYALVNKEGKVVCRPVYSGDIDALVKMLLQR